MSNVKMKSIIVKISPEAHKTLKHISVDTGKSVGALVVEAARKGDPERFASLATCDKGEDVAILPDTSDDE